MVTKAVGYYDKDGDKDAEDITAQYKNLEGSQEERLAVFNAVKGVDRVSIIQIINELITTNNACVILGLTVL